MVQRRSPVRDRVAVRRRRYIETAETVEDLGIFRLAAETARRADPRQRDLAHQSTVEIILINAARSVFEISGKDRPSGRRRPLQQVFRLRNHICGHRHSGIQIDRHQPEVRRLRVGQHIGRIPDAIHDGIVVRKALEERFERRVRHGQTLIEYLVAARPLRSDDEEPPEVVAHKAREVAQGMRFIFINQPVFRLRSSQFVEIDFLVFVFRGVCARPLCRRIVAAVVEAAVSPAGAAELHPFDLVRQLLARSDLHHIDLDPVRPRPGNGIGCIAVVFREGDGIQRHGSVRRQGVGVEEDLRRTVEPFAVIQHALVLQAVVPVEEVVLADAERCPLFRIVVKFGEPLFDLSAIRNLGQIVLRHSVLSGHPGGGFVRPVVFEPAVRVCHPRTVVIVHHGGVFSGFGIRFRFDSHRALTAGCDCGNGSHSGKVITIHRGRKVFGFAIAEVKLIVFLQIPILFVPLPVDFIPCLSAGFRSERRMKSR